MANRQTVERLLHELYAARRTGHLEQLCALFDAHAQFKIAGTSDGKPINLSARGAEEIRSWLAVMVKTFRLSNHRIQHMLIDGEKAAVHWSADIHSKVTGVMVPTDLVDLVAFSGEYIVSYTEYFVPS